MPYCVKCGHMLEERQLKGEGVVPYCPVCEEFRFPGFSVCCSMIVMDPEAKRILLIKQYGRVEYILVAGYVMKGEDAEQTVVREIREELGVSVKRIKFNRTHYFPPSNVLMVNFTVQLESEQLHPNEEIDSFRWFTPEEARNNIHDGGLAQIFLNGYLDGLRETEYVFPKQEDMRLV